MQCFNHWPDMTKLALPDEVVDDFYRHLIEPFDDNEADAKALWDEMPSTIIILNDFDSVKRLMHCSIWDQIKFALTYPEYTEPLKQNYQIMVAIVNDAGSAIYLIIPPGLSLLNAEGRRFEQDA